MSSKKYVPTVLMIYLCYMMHGIALIILSQNINYLQEQMHTDYAGVMFVVSGLGIGKLVTQYAGGVLSDRLGRRPFVLLGIVGYAVFFLGILVSPNIYVGFAFSFLCGFGNTCLDAGGTTALMEIMHKMMGTASIITKLFIAAGQFLLPLVIGIITLNQMYYGASFLMCAGMLALLGIGLIRAPFMSAKEQEEQAKQAAGQKTALALGPAKANMKIEGAALVVIGFTSTATFYTVINWITIYARDVARLSDTAAQSIMSFYSTGAILAVTVTAILVQKYIKPARLLMIYPTLAALCLCILLQHPTELVCRIMGFFIGCFAGGGVLQLAAAVIVEFFPERKGTVTSMVFTASGLAMFAGSNITGWLSSMSVSYVIVYDIAATLLGIALAVVVNIRYNQVMLGESGGVIKELKVKNKLSL